MTDNDRTTIGLLLIGIVVLTISSLLLTQFGIDSLPIPAYTRTVFKTITHSFQCVFVTLMLGVIFHVVGRCLWKIVRRSQYLHFER